MDIGSAISFDDLIFYHVCFIGFVLNEIKAILGERIDLDRGQNLGSSSTYLHHLKGNGRDGLKEQKGRTDHLLLALTLSWAKKVSYFLVFAVQNYGDNKPACSLNS